MKFRFATVLLCAFVATAAAAFAPGKTQARLLIAADEARPGDRILAAIELTMPEGWHTYWRNAGDSGMRTTIEWTLPEGIHAEPIQWPAPEKYQEAGFTTYVYHDTVLLLIPLSIDEDAAAGATTLRGRVDWLECEKICIPGTAEVEAELKVGSRNVRSSSAELIEEWRDRLPAANPEASVRAEWAGEPDDGSRPFRVEWPDAVGKEGFDFFPYKSDDFDVSGDTRNLGPATIGKTVTLYGEEWPKELQGLIVPVGDAKAFEVSLPLAQTEASTAGGAPTETAAGEAISPIPGQGGHSLWKMLIFAFIGGLILNVMPCVLPVISLKILGFVNQSQDHPKRVRQLGMLFVAGVLVSFLAMAGLVIAAKQVGPANWGMQFQNPYFLVAMTVLILLVALNLFGVFEVRLSGGAMGAAGALASKEGGSGAFFNGVLATILATPCTAPFLGTALGFAFLQPAAVVVLMFLTIGLGLAAPYFILSMKPGWLKHMPRPGAWMEKFKIALGFPMLATALWLFALTTRHFGKGGVLWFGMFLVMVALAAWIWGEFVQRGERRRWLATAIAAAVAIGGYAYAMENELQWRSAEARAAAREQESGTIVSEGGIPWMKWSRQGVAEARQAGHPVLIDFTADWCLSCQVNKKTSLEIESVRERLATVNAVAFLADYTFKDPKITSELQRFGRSGVPLVVVYPADPDAPAIVLPELLTPSIVLDALDQAAGDIGQLSARPTASAAE